MQQEVHAPPHQAAFRACLALPCKIMADALNLCSYCRLGRTMCSTSSSTAAPSTETESAARSPQSLGVSSNGANSHTHALTFQEAIARLQSYWASVGCAVWQPFNSEVGLTIGRSISGLHCSALLILAGVLYMEQDPCG